MAGGYLFSLMDRAVLLRCDLIELLEKLAEIQRVADSNAHTDRVDWLVGNGELFSGER